MIILLSFLWFFFRSALRRRKETGMEQRDSSIWSQGGDHEAIRRCPNVRKISDVLFWGGCFDCPAACSSESQWEGKDFFSQFFRFCLFKLTPLKISMEPKNYPIEKDKIIFQTSIFGFHVSFRGSIVERNPKFWILEAVSVRMWMSGWAISAVGVNFFHADRSGSSIYTPEV